MFSTSRGSVLAPRNRVIRGGPASVYKQRAGLIRPVGDPAGYYRLTVATAVAFANKGRRQQCYFPRCSFVLSRYLTQLCKDCARTNSDQFRRNTSTASSS